MSKDDFATEVARRRLQAIDVETMAHQTAFAAHEAQGDYEAAEFEAQQIADLRAQRRNIEQVYADHQRARNPVPVAPETDAEWHAKSADKMNQFDALRVYGKSKYFPADPANDADFVKRYNEGLAEAARRRAYESGR